MNRNKVTLSSCDDYDYFNDSIGKYDYNEDGHYEEGGGYDSYGFDSEGYDCNGLDEWGYDEDCNGIYD